VAQGACRAFLQHTHHRLIARGHGRVTGRSPAILVHLTLEPIRAPRVQARGHLQRNHHSRSWFWPVHRWARGARAADVQTPYGVFTLRACPQSASLCHPARAVAPSSPRRTGVWWWQREKAGRPWSGRRWNGSARLIGSHFTPTSGVAVRRPKTPPSLISAKLPPKRSADRRFRRMRNGVCARNACSVLPRWPRDRPLIPNHRISRRS